MAEEQKTYNAGDEDQVAKARGEAEIREYLRKSGLRKLMSDVEGRAWMFGLLSTTGFACSSFSHDALTMAFKEGQRANRIIAGGRDKQAKSRILREDVFGEYHEKQ